MMTRNRTRMLKDRQLKRCQNPQLASVIERNMDVIEEHWREADQMRTTHDRVADAITWISGSMPFVYFHVVLFAVWILVNLNVGGIPEFDPYPFGMLTTIVSLEAIFLSTFVLVSQNRQAAIADRRTELDLQINLLTEYEVTRILRLVNEIAGRQHLSGRQRENLDELKKDVQPAELLGELETRAEKHDGGKPIKSAN